MHLPTPPQSADSGGHKIVFVKSWKEATLTSNIITFVKFSISYITFRILLYTSPLIFTNGHFNEILYL